MYIYCLADTLDKDDGGGERRCFIFIVSPLCISGWAAPFSDRLEKKLTPPLVPTIDVFLKIKIIS